MKFHIKTFNPLFWLLILVTIVFAYLYKLFYLSFGETASKILFTIIYIFMFFYYFYYKIKLSNDEEHARYCDEHNVPRSELLSELLPLQLCNVTYILLPLGILFDINACLGFGLFMAPLAVIIALLTPYPGLSDDSLLKTRVAGYYFTHLFILFMSLIIWTTKKYELNYALAFETFIILFVSSAVAHITNLFLHKSGLCLSSNYFFTMNPNVSFITKIFYKLIPIKWVYEFPIYILLWMCFNLIVFIYNLF